MLFRAREEKGNRAWSDGEGSHAGCGLGTVGWCGGRKQGFWASVFVFMFTTRSFYEAGRHTPDGRGQFLGLYRRGGILYELACAIDVYIRVKIHIAAFTGDHVLCPVGGGKWFAAWACIREASTPSHAWAGSPFRFERLRGGLPVWVGGEG